MIEPMEKNILFQKIQLYGDIEILKYFLLIFKCRSIYYILYN